MGIPQKKEPKGSEKFVKETSAVVDSNINNNKLCDIK